jgi:hypothetical protein
MLFFLVKCYEAKKLIFFMVYFRIASFDRFVYSCFSIVFSLVVFSVLVSSLFSGVCAWEEDSVFYYGLNTSTGNISVSGETVSVVVDLVVYVAADLVVDEGTDVAADVGAETDFSLVNDSVLGNVSSASVMVEDDASMIFVSQEQPSAMSDGSLGVVSGDVLQQDVQVVSSVVESLSPPVLFVQGNDSSVSFIRVPKLAVSGEEVSVSLDVYRGDTRKYVVYFWVESDGKKVSSVSKFSADSRFSGYNMSLVVLMKKICFKDGSLGVLHVEGLGVESESGVELVSDSGCAVSVSGTVEHDEDVSDRADLAVSGSVASDISEKSGSDDKKRRSVSYDIISSPGVVEFNSSFKVRVNVSNPTDDDFGLSVYGAVSAKSSRHPFKSENLSLVLVSGAIETFDIDLVASEKKENQTVRIYLQRSDRKMPVVLSADIRVILPLEVKKDSEDGGGRLGSGCEGDDCTAGLKGDGAGSGIVFESSSARAKRFTIYFMFAAFLMLFSFVVLKRI